MNKYKTSRTAAACRALGCSVAALVFAVSPLRAAQTDISSTPITNSSSAQVKPNIMLLMDTSDSMSFGHMPDEVEPLLGPTATPWMAPNAAGAVGYKNHQCNILYYNPATTYKQPKRADGSFFPVPPFGAAPYDVFDTLSVVTVDLATSFTPYDNSSLRNGGWTYPLTPAYYYVHTGGTPITSYTSPACADFDAGTTQPASDGGTWTRVAVSAGEQANFAIWYTYYRTRIAMIKSAASLAFTPLTDSFRVGLITVNPKYPNNVPITNDSPNAPINPEKYLRIADFDSTQRNAWFDKLFAQKTGGTSPAREGLARVGRHYAGKTDGINTGMPEDPVQYSCQQNFTIMTTDGYWNDNAETVGAGPVKINGTTPVGQQDGSLDAMTTNTDFVPPDTMNFNGTPRPIWDGRPDGQRVTTNKRNSYSYSPCGTYFYRTELQANRSTSQTTTTTSQTTQSTMQSLQSTYQMRLTQRQALQSSTQVALSTVQNLQSTNQNLQSTNQNLQSTVQTRQSTLQNLQSTVQNLRSTSQNVQNTSQTVDFRWYNEQVVRINLQSTTQTLQSTSRNVYSTSQTRIRTQQNRQSTTQTLQATSQNLRTTAQTTQSTAQIRQSTVQNLTSTSQIQRSTSQATRSTLQSLTSTFQELQSTSQTTVSTVQLRRSTSQTSRCADSGETCTPQGGVCSPGGGYHCETVNTGPTLVASCTAADASDTNNFVQTTCASTTTGPTPVGSCTPVTAGPGNSYTTTTCNTQVTSSIPVDICNAAPAGIANAWTATTCTPLTTGPTPTDGCTPIAATSGNSWTQTSCTFPTTGPTPVASCPADIPASAPLWTSTTCGTATTTNVPVGSCVPDPVPTAGNSYTTTTCNTVVTTNVPTPTCSPATAAAGNAWTTRTCSNNNTTNVGVASCTPSAATAPFWIATSCPGAATTGPFGVDTCTAVGANAGNSFTATTCGTNNANNVPVSSCTASTRGAGNNWTETTCSTNNTPATGVQNCVAAAASALNAWTTTTCTPNNTTNVAVATCTPAVAAAANFWTATTCPAPIVTGPTVVDATTCTPAAATALNSYVATTCPVTLGTDLPKSGACVPISPNAGNSWTTTTCPTPPITTGPTAVASCTTPAPAAGNNWTTTTCTPNNSTNVPVGTCTAAAPVAGNGYTTTTCPAPTPVSGPTRVQTCTPVIGNAGNGWRTTVCTVRTLSVPSGTCVPEAASAANNWTTTECNVVVGTSVPVLTCTPQTGNAGNNWLTITCPGPIVTTNVPVATCTASGPNGGNAFTTTTCPTPITTTNVPVLSCSASAAAAGNNFTTTTCPTPITTGPAGVASCAASPANIGNNFVATTCTPNNTTNVPVLGCTAAVAGPGNSWTETTCPAPVVTTNVAVITCTSAAASLANNWTTTTCPPPITTTNVPVSSCAPAGASAGNGYTSFTCPAPITTGPTNVASCTAEGAIAGNNWTATICTTNNTTNVPVASCTPQTAGPGNGWQEITCTNNDIVDQPVANCTAQAPSAANNHTAITCTPTTTTNVPVATCSPAIGAPANAFTTTTCTFNNANNVPVASCTPVSPDAGNGYTTTTCPVVVSGPTGVASCTASGPNAGNLYVTRTCATVNTGPTPVASCAPISPAAGNAWLATTCNTIVTGPVVDATCTAANPNVGNNFTRTTCVPTTGNKIQYTTTTTVDTTFYSGGNPSGSLPTVTTVTGPTDLDGMCYAPDVTPPALPTPNPGPATWTAADATEFPSCTSWDTACVVATALGGARSVNSLADVAQYYYITDLRLAADWPDTIANNDVFFVGSGPQDDRARWQHMTTFTVALGISGELKYDPDYKSGVPGDFADIVSGAKNWPLWPDPSLDYTNKSLWNNPKSIDDYWHTAVNGRGTYFSAADPTSVINGLAKALAGIKARQGSGSAAATSNLEPVSGDNLIFLASYTTQKWTGDVQAKEIDLGDGSILPTVVWSAQTKLQTRTRNFCDDRNIFLFRQGATDNLTNFTWNTSVCDGAGNPASLLPDGLNAAEQAQFGTLNVSLLSQYPSMTDGTTPTVDQRTPATGANLVNFLRGQRGYEGFVTNNATKLYRAREAVLGDIVNGQPTYVRAPFSLYGDTDYALFKSSNVGRTPMLYVPGNDGMLHAFYAGINAADPLGGKEAWAFIPSMVLPKLYRLADDNYKDNHAYFVDGTPSVSDMYDAGSGTWKTILVAGLNNGGKGYYALDVTNPLAPKGLWEFKWNSAVCPWAAGNTAIGAAVNNTSDCHLGQSYGRPVITKLTDGTWVVLVTSGYNNVNAPPQAGDGIGYLYVLNAATGRIMHKIPTGVGDATTPSGLAQINTFADLAEINNMSLRAYGTDVLGNIWRFDINDSILPSGREATLVGTATDPGGTPQPITIRPEISVKDGNPMLFVGTGRFLGASDLSLASPQVQSVYGFVDPMTGSPAYANLRSALVPLTLTQGGSGSTTYRTVACAGTVAQCAVPDGWVVNLPDLGERVNVEMKLRSGTLVVGSNVPQISACADGGYSWLNFFNYRDGTALPGGTATGGGLGREFSVSQQFSNFLIVGITIVKLPGVGTKPQVYVTGSDSSIERVEMKFAPGDNPKRVSWREISAP